MPKGIKKFLLWVLVGFIVYAIITNPDGSADIVKAIWHVIAEGFKNIGRFFSGLMD